MREFLPIRPLERAIGQATDGLAEVTGHAAAAWASVTFAGSRHVVTLRFAGGRAVAAGEALIGDLDLVDVPGRLVGEAVVRSVLQVADRQVLTVVAEWLLLEDA